MTSQYQEYFKSEELFRRQRTANRFKTLLIEVDNTRAGEFEGSKTDYSVDKVVVMKEDGAD